jgi:hypothetical protein
MNRRHVLAGLAAFILPADAFAQTDASPEAVIQAMYQVHVAEIEANRQGVLYTPALQRRFLTPALAAALVRERRRSAEGLGGDPITETNGDPVVRNLQVRQLSADQERATVLVTFNQWDNQRVELRYVLARIDGAWLVYDIVLSRRRGQQDDSLRRSLRLRS